MLSWLRTQVTPQALLPGRGHVVGSELPLARPAGNTVSTQTPGREKRASRREASENKPETVFSERGLPQRKSVQKTLYSL